MNVTLCRNCKKPVSFARLAADQNRWVCLEAAPLSDLLKDSNRCWVVAETWAHHARDIEELIQVNREVSQTAARRIAREDFPWHAGHHCEEVA